ncbi:hypothetical protein C1646_777208 [Rhizophagus diaphanus]|nr:hypothetical protein C1646_777208 [Rhizophagus diaphanus] [Rhizophagus sp. MUCL 43196]
MSFYCRLHQEGGSLSRTRPEAEINIYQVSDIIPEGETIREMAQRIIWDNLSERDVKAISRALVETSIDAIVALSQITRASNKIQQERTEQRKNEGLHYLDHFLLELVKERLDLYDVSNTSDKQTLADVMIMLCIRPAEIKNLCIANGGVTGYAKNQGQQDILRLRDSRKPGSIYLSSFLKKDEYIPKLYEPLLPSSLRKLGAVFASIVHGPKNPSKANTYASKALQDLPDNHASPSDRYTIVNFRRRRQPYDQVKPFWISDETNHIYGLEDRDIIYCEAPLRLNLFIFCSPKI